MTIAAHQVQADISGELVSSIVQSLSASDAQNFSTGSLFSEVLVHIHATLNHSETRQSS